jgi:hypothetical protein
MYSRACRVFTMFSIHSLRNRKNYLWSGLSPDVVEEHSDSRQELAGNCRSLQTQKVFDLGGCDQECDAVSKADRHWPGDVPNGGAQTGEPHNQQQNASHDPDQRQTTQAEFHDDAVVSP